MDRSRAVDSRLLRPKDRAAALNFLARDAVENLFLMDLTARLGTAPDLGEVRTEIVGAWRDQELIGIAGLRPNVVLDARAEKEIVEAFLPYVEALSIGLVKSFVPAVDELWNHICRQRDRRTLVDRVETAYALSAEEAELVEVRTGERVRAATQRDLAEMIIAARESLREESRPDPFSGDIKGFQHWVRGRIPRARVVELAGRIVMVGYADVQRREGWLLQGIYTWPEYRRRGFAAYGVSALCREAFASGADHVQLAVIDGNVSARNLYEGLGFKPFGKLRTILFT